MKLSELKPSRDIPFYPILLADRFLPHKFRQVLLSWYEYIFAAIFLAAVAIRNHIIVLSPAEQSRVIGAASLFAALWFIIFMLEAFFRSYYFGVAEAEVDAGDIVCRARRMGGDIPAAIFKSGLGKKFLKRSGILRDALNNFLADRKLAGKIIPDYVLPAFVPRDFFTTALLVSSVVSQDEGFNKFLSDSGLNTKDVSGIIDWIIADDSYYTAKKRWWTKENLGKYPAIGKDWAFGQTGQLDKVGTCLMTMPNLLGERFDRSYRRDLVATAFAGLSRARGAGIVIIGDSGSGPSGVILDMAREIVRGRVSPGMAFRRLIELDWNKLIAESKHKTEFEGAFTQILNETLVSGNVVLVIKDFVTFMMSADALGSQVVGLLAPYLERGIKLIISTDMGGYHRFIESNGALASYFDKVVINEPDDKKTLEIMEGVARAIEKKYKVVLTYQGIIESIRSASQYITNGIMPAKAIDLLCELAGSGLVPKGSAIGKAEVLAMVQAKTNIPVGDLAKGEKDVLLNLERELHKRVVGQDEAILTISGAMRRARAGTRDMKKPMGTFLFLGPTGVGKTETAKALAALFFGDEKFMMRLDMSEYQSADALDKLIGSFKSGTPGVLSNMLRATPYGVLLLDEFEKADKNVLNLFLQILDEGFFSDMTGKRVSARNLIIIATSNAASGMIFDITEAGGDLSGAKTGIIDKIVGDGVYKPELLNRFDDVVLFHPLNKEAMRIIAGLMLKKLAARLREKGIELIINDYLVGRLSEIGYDRTFGARPMNRAILEKVEDPIAKKIISGDIGSGSKVEFGGGDFVV